MLGTLLIIVLVLLGAGVLHYLIGAAPFIGPPYKGAAQWIVLVVAVVWVCIALYKLIQGAV